jgi:Fe-S cluster biosynthesis and repair protein YggX
MADDIKCTHCGEKRPGLGFAPFPNALGQRIAAEICQPCWRDWLQKQTQIIKGYLFGDTPNVAEIDTTKEGSVKW